MIRVLIIQAQIKKYRVPFFDKLYEALEGDGIRLRVGYSDPPPADQARRNNCDLPDEYGVKVKACRGLGNKAIWQPLLGEVAAADLVVVEQANKYLMNHLLLLCSITGIKKVAFWGHGRSRQSQTNGVSEWLKRQTINRVSWWFAYTAETVEYLTRYGVGPEKITNVQNAIDTTAFRKELDSVSDSELVTARKELGICEESRVGLFCGVAKREKLLGFLVGAVARIKEMLPKFELLAVGGGPEQAHLERAADENPWFHYLGPRFGREKALCFRLADAFLMPGPVGLAILDAFAAGLPTFTTDIAAHGPEIDYLEDGKNGLLTPHDVGSYAMAVARVLSDRGFCQELARYARESSAAYSIETMVGNFRSGLLQCLSVAAER